MAIEEDELIRNEDGDIIGYEGEGAAILTYISLGLTFGLLIGLLFFSGDTVIKTDAKLTDARDYCQHRGFDWGLYTGGPGISGKKLGITCHPEKDGSYTKFYFDLNMTQIGKEEVRIE